MYGYFDIVKIESSRFSFVLAKALVDHMFRKYVDVKTIRIEIF